MLGIGGTAAIADDQELVARAKRCDDSRRNLARGGEQSRVLRRSLQCCERSFKMRGDRVFQILLQDAPSGLQSLSLVMIAPQLRKLASSTRNARPGLGH